MITPFFKYLFPNHKTISKIINKIKNLKKLGWATFSSRNALFYGLAKPRILIFSNLNITHSCTYLSTLFLILIFLYFQNLSITFKFFQNYAFGSTCALLPLSSYSPDDKRWHWTSYSSLAVIRLHYNEFSRLLDWLGFYCSCRTIGSWESNRNSFQAISFI